MEILLSMDRVAFTIGSLSVYWYALFIVCGMVLGLAYLMWQGKRINLTADDGIEFFLWVVPIAVVCARLLYVIVRPEEYFSAEAWSEDSTEAFLHVVAVRDGGLTIIGGILGGFAGLCVFAYRMRKKANFGQVLDLIVVPLFIGQIIGRLGNFVNQEAFGKPSSVLGIPEFFPFSVYIDHPSGVEAEFADIVYDNVPGYFAATFFYEMVWNTIGAVFCFCVWRKNKKYPGLLGIFYFFWYFLGRLWLEQLRIDAVPITTVACAVMFPVALALGVLYILTKDNVVAFRKVNNAFVGGTLESETFTAMEVKHYLFAVNFLKKSGMIAWKLYKVDSITVADENILKTRIAKKEKTKATV